MRTIYCENNLLYDNLLSLFYVLNTRLFFSFQIYTRLKMPGEGNLGDAKFILKNGIKMPAVGCKSKYCYWMLFNLYFIKLLKFAFFRVKLNRIQIY